MAYNQSKLDFYRSLLTRADQPSTHSTSMIDPEWKYECPTCPYCNGSRDPTVKYINPATKPNSCWSFWQDIVIDKFRKTQSISAMKNMRCAFPSTSPEHRTQNRDKMFVVGPMVDQSELPFRLLCREYGSTLTYTPMLHAKSFAESATYRRNFLSTTPLEIVREALKSEKEADTNPEGLVTVDRPVFVQFCGSDADTVLRAARYAVHGEEWDGKSEELENDVLAKRVFNDAYPLFCCDAVDLNLGCPQGIARRGHYGSFLMEEWDTIHTILHTLHCELEVPVTAKMRIFDRADGVLDEPLTIAYAKMLRDAGASVICIHGRTRAMKGQESGLADMAFLKRLYDAMGGTVPIITNGNVLSYGDVVEHLRTIGAEGHMCAEPLLWDPALFANHPLHFVPSGRLDIIAGKDSRIAAIERALRYVEYVRHWPVSLGFVKAHLFKMCYHSYEILQEMREELSALPVSSSVPVSQKSTMIFSDEKKRGEKLLAEVTPEALPYWTELKELDSHLRRLLRLEATTTAVEEQKKLTKMDRKRLLRETEGLDNNTDATVDGAPFNWFENDENDEPLGFQFE